MTDKKVDTWMPFLVDKYLGDTTHLNTEQHGAYFLLLLTCWKRGGELPDDDEQLQAITRLQPARWKTCRGVLREFFDTDAGVLRQKRLTAELARAKANLNQKSEAGKASAAKRQAEREVNGKATDVATAGATDAQRTPQRDSNSIPTSIEEISKASPSHPPVAGRTPSIPCPYQAIVELYHAALPALPKVRLMPKGRQTALRKVWGWVLSSTKSDGGRRATNADEALHWLGGYFARAADNDFLMGRTPRSAEHADWRCDLDFLLTDKGMKQVIEKTQEAA